jgi:hypothetical protein
MMFDFFKRTVKNQKGAMDKILVTLLLVIVGVGAVVGLSTWVNTEVGTMQTTASGKISNASAT